MTKNLEEIIEFENENTELDFKSIQYVKSNYENLLKDLISMANAKTSNERHIIIGVKHKTNGNREILGIEDAFIDDATYQEIANQNIEPELNFIYYPFDFKGNKLGIFKIFDCTNPPYMMKRAKGKLNIGDSFIRKGSHQARLTRKDIDYYIERRISIDKFNGELAFYFDKIGNKELYLKPKLIDKTPSEKAKQKILEIIKSKEDSISKTPKSLISPFVDFDYSVPGMSTPYEKRSIKTLRENLKNIEITYEEDDLYYIYEENSLKFNFSILNLNNSYLEDAMIEVRISNKNILICNKIYSKPVEENHFLGVYSPKTSFSLEQMNYPNIKETENEFIIRENLGDLKHQIEKSAFNVPLRILLNPNSVGENIKIQIKMFGKNLKEPIKDNLIIQVIE
ncbi:ATP-binding protein [Polaribacter sp. R2A056_3_33]|jgi:hypothetical protein|uniref:ATP-binding protein n=1 Tax=Polaribacter sp. R2A056_3_33 TaxID=2745563 RepID=UPI001C4FBB9D|nr:ATP-binding protein [Polaribacter sp. R2A056_3_33]QXP71247.1 ATP-binding protein [Polaribacter sp. R2A056_3_33]